MISFNCLNLTIERNVRKRSFQLFKLSFIDNYFSASIEKDKLINTNKIFNKNECN